MIADVSKTVRFTVQAWERWKRLIGKRYMHTWADVVNNALQDLEASMVKNGELAAYTPPGLVSKNVPDLFNDDPPPAAVEVKPAPPPCSKCGGVLLVGTGDEKGQCQSCQLEEKSGGKIKRGTTLPKPDRKAAPPAVRDKRKTAPVKNGAARPVKRPVAGTTAGKNGQKGKGK